MIELNILEIARHTAWRYKKSSDPNHSDTYTFNERKMIDFAQKVKTLLMLEINRCAVDSDTCGAPKPCKCEILILSPFSDLLSEATK